jgi:ABC-2 type transport system ATP-binding protein
MSIIHARGLRRSFGRRGATVDAVRGIDLDVAEGEIVAFLGPNGAGKTTTLRMLTTLLRPTSGSATIAGADLLADPTQVRRRIGYVAQSGGTDPNTRVGAELELQGRLYGLSATAARSRAEQLCAQLDLAGLTDRYVRTLSGGQRRRLDIAFGLMHDPRLLFLDEPSVGLDPQSRSNLWSHIRRLRADNGTTIFLTTHYLDEADALCDRILVIDNGELVAQDSPDALKRRFATEVVTVEVAGDPEFARILLAEQVAVIESSVELDGTIRLTVADGRRALPDLMRGLAAADLPLTSIQLARPTLDDVFLTLTGRSPRETA